jgi:hypothetical protein
MGEPHTEVVKVSSGIERALVHRNLVIEAAEAGVSLSHP